MKKITKKIAVIGSGISGLTAAWLLQQKYEVTLYERENYLGGHSCTVDVTLPEGKTIPIDIGFIVFNYRTYPGLKKLFEHFEVPLVKSNMSFGVSIENQLEYGSDNMLALRNIIRPQYLKMLYDIIKFNRRAQKILAGKYDGNIGSYFQELKSSQLFYEYYLLAMAASVWSTSLEKMKEFPGDSLLKFFDNHGLLTIGNKPQWWTVAGGSREYVKRMMADFKGDVKLQTAVKKVIRKKGDIILRDDKGNELQYDGAVLASHANQSLAMLEQPSTAEQDVLSRFEYQVNNIVLHSDENFMPKNRDAWSSWVYRKMENQDANQQGVNVSYWMNNLQQLPTDLPMIVSLNPEIAPDKDKIWCEREFSHPLFTQNAIKAQQELNHIQGKDKIWYVGAYQNYGFHEDGFQSAIKMVKQGFGITPLWEQ